MLSAFGRDVGWDCGARNVCRWAGHIRNIGPVDDGLSVNGVRYASRTFGIIQTEASCCSSPEFVSPWMSRQALENRGPASNCGRFQAREADEKRRHLPPSSTRIGGRVSDEFERGHVHAAGVPPIIRVPFQCGILSPWVPAGEILERAGPMGSCLMLVDGFREPQFTASPHARLNNRFPFRL